MQKSKDNMPIYQTITGGRIALANLSEAEHAFLAKVAKKYNARQDWTCFAAWWNAEFNASGLATSSVAYRICQDLETRLGIDQGKVAPPDYRDFLIELIDTQFGSRQEFCRRPEVDPGQLSRVLASRGDLSIRVLQKVLEVVHAHLVIQTEEELRARTSIHQATAALASLAPLQTSCAAPQPDAIEEPANDLEQPISQALLRQMIEEQLTPLRE